MIINALYLYGINIYLKLYNFNLQLKINKKFNHFYKTINIKKDLIYYLKYYSIFLYFKKISKNIKKNIFRKKSSEIISRKYFPRYFQIKIYFQKPKNYF